MQLYEVANAFLDAMEETYPDLTLQLKMEETVTGRNASAVGKCINSAAVETLAEELQFLIANVVATLIDAGSERDAVMENQELTDAITKELNGWTEKEIES